MCRQPYELEKKGGTSNRDVGCEPYQNCINRKEMVIEKGEKIKASKTKKKKKRKKKKK